MDKVFIVSWVFVSFVSAPCPDYKPDPITGQYPQTVCAVYHATTSEYKKDSVVIGEKKRDDLIETLNNYGATNIKVEEIEK